MNCEMCGKDAPLAQTEIEGTYLNLCSICAKHGKVIKRIHIPSGNELKKKAKAVKEERARPAPPMETKKTLMIRGDYAARVKRAREKLGLKQEELAKLLAVKESLIHHIEAGKFEPRTSMARRFEKFLHISLIESVEEKEIIAGSNNSKDLTIGDMITIKKRGK